MKRSNNLYTQICSMESLEAAWKNVRLGKRYDKEVLRFGYDIHSELINLHNELTWKKYQVGRYREFTIKDPKERLIQYLPLRDRIVQQSLHQTIEPIFDKGFIFDSYACRKGKGTHRGMKRLQYFMNAACCKWPGKEIYYLHCDIRKYFPHIDHEILYGRYCRKIKCADTLKLIKVYIESSTSAPGQPIGCLSSQLSANIYMDVVDQFVKHDLREQFYLRYMDNFIIIHHDKQHLQRVKEDVRRLLESCLRLELNQKVTMINKIANGIEFVGYRVYADHVKIKKASFDRMKKRLRTLHFLYKNNKISIDKITQRIRSWIGHAEHGNTHRLREGLLNQFSFERGVSGRSFHHRIKSTLILSKGFRK